MALQAPNYIQDGSTAYTAEDFRYNLETSCSLGEGVSGLPDYRVTQKASGANMSVDVAAGIGWVRGDTSTRQGLYHVVNDATVNVAITTADSTDPRIDQVILRIYDDSYDGSGNFEATLEVLAGTPTTGADLDNRDGAASLPDSAMMLADVLVPASATSITDSDINSRRRFVHDKSALITLAMGGADTEYPYGDVYDSSLLAPHPVYGFGMFWDSPDLGTWFYGNYMCLLVWSYERRQGINTARWAYKQNATPITGSYRWGLFDTQGFLLTDTGTVAFSGSGGATVSAELPLSETIDLEPGPYIAVFWLASLLSGNSPEFWGYVSNPPAYYRTVTSSVSHSRIGPPGVVGLDNVGSFPDKLDASDQQSAGPATIFIPVMQLSAE